MKDFVKELKKESKWVIFREIFFIVLFIITVIGFGITLFAQPGAESNSRAIEDTQQATPQKVAIRGRLACDEVVERGPRYVLYPIAVGVNTTQYGNASMEMIFTENFGELVIDIYDMSDNIVMQLLAHTRYQSTFKMNISLLEPGSYWLQYTNSLGGNAVSMFEIK